MILLYFKYYMLCSLSSIGCLQHKNFSDQTAGSATPYNASMVLDSSANNTLPRCFCARGDATLTGYASKNTTSISNLTTFTIEAYIYISSKWLQNSDVTASLNLAENQCIIGTGTGSTNETSWGLYYNYNSNPTNDLKFNNTARTNNVTFAVFRRNATTIHNGNNIFTFVSVQTAISGNIYLDTWTHIAVTRDASNNLTLFINGTNVTSTVFTTSLNTTGLVFAKRYSNTQSNPSVGGVTNTSVNNNIYTIESYNNVVHKYYNLMSRIRISRNVYYTNNFIPSTTQFVHTSNDIGIWNVTQINHYVSSDSGITLDNNGLGAPITGAGITRFYFTRFKATYAYTEAFNNLGLTKPIITNILNLSSNPFTIEFYFSLNNASTDTASTTGYYGTNNLYIFTVGDMTSNFYSVALLNKKLSLISNNATHSVEVDFINNIFLHHCAVTRDSDNMLRIFINGEKLYENLAVDNSGNTLLYNASNISLGSPFYRQTVQNENKLPQNSCIAKVMVSSICKYTNSFTTEVPSVRTPYFISPSNTNNILFMYDPTLYDNQQRRVTFGTANISRMHTEGFQDLVDLAVNF